MKTEQPDPVDPSEPADEIVIESENLSGEEGDFLRGWHRRIRHRRPAGELTAPYQCDSVVRSMGMDAVAMVLHRRRQSGALEVGLRGSMRPTLALDADPQRGGRPSPRLWELPAGILEAGDVGDDGLRRRCSAEALEEMGARVPPGDFVSLGSPLWLSPGVIAERVYLFEAALGGSDLERAEGDGSPMEQDAPIRWLTVDEALALCRDGASDAKTEVALLRFNGRW